MNRVALTLLAAAVATVGCTGLQDLGDHASDAGSSGDTAEDPLAVDPALVDDMKAAIQRTWSKDVVYSVTLVGKRWQVRVNDAGVPFMRTVATVVRSKTESGTCGDFEVVFAQESTDGGASYGPVDYWSVGTKTDVPCP